MAESDVLRYSFAQRYDLSCSGYGLGRRCPYHFCVCHSGQISSSDAGRLPKAHPHAIKKGRPRDQTRGSRATFRFGFSDPDSEGFSCAKELPGITAKKEERLPTVEGGLETVDSLHGRFAPMTLTKEFEYWNWQEY